MNQLIDILGLIRRLAFSKSIKILQLKWCWMISVTW